MLYDAWVASPNFQLYRTAENRKQSPRDVLGLPISTLGETWLVAYTPGRRFSYRQALARGVYFGSFASLPANFLGNEQAVRLRQLRTRLRPGAFDKAEVHLSEGVYPHVSRYWRSIDHYYPRPGFYLGRARFKCISLGTISLRVLDLRYRPRRHAHPVITVQVPAYFITELIAFDGRMHP
ncbi:hypothetical protein [Hymenobacter sp. CRA2]|uniref:hypothetical protein n=1 Tax=Hymenobacter sp. CRA2 TaxID=1955620 RepID=UPI001590D92E|nr:hypothetical protein [Hymenobacter sp. CRA2]